MFNTIAPPRSGGRTWARLVAAVVVIFAFAIACSNGTLSGEKDKEGMGPQVECAAGSTACGGECVTVTSDNAHCGACGNVCPAGAPCEGGVCSCPSGEQACGGACVETAFDPAHCGACGSACSAGQFCVEGQCAEDCGDLTTCGELCVDPATDDANCGACGTLCSGGQVCTDGNCACLSGQESCDGTCVDKMVDHLNCGVCGNACSSETSCVNGVCECPMGETECDGSCSNLLDDEANCGACGVACFETHTCNEGQCSCEGGPGACLARNVTVTLVEANQGTSVALGDEGTVLPMERRNADLIEGRPTLVRAHFELGDNWQARNIRGVLTLIDEDGVEEVFDVEKRITSDSEIEELDSTFTWMLEPESVKPNMAMNIVLEESEATSGPVAAVPPRFPQEGNADVGIVAGDMLIKMVVIPAITASGAPVSTPERRANLRNHVFDLYPVQDVVIDWREPVAVPPNPSSTGEMFSVLRDICEQDDAGSDVIYHMIVNKDDTSLSQAGTANGSLSTRRTCRAVSLTLVNPRSGEDAVIDGNVNTVAHELGHNHGRSHAPCGTTGDPDFPYEDGFLGAQGYSISENELKSTDEYHELMGYCRPRWISDWMWQRFGEKVRETTEAAANFVVADERRSLSGFVDTKTGKAYWAVVDGALAEFGPRESLSEYAKVLIAGEEVLLPLTVIPSSEPVMSEIVVTLPEGPLPTRAEFSVGGHRHLVDFSKVKVY